MSAPTYYTYTNPAPNVAGGGLELTNSGCLWVLDNAVTATLSHGIFGDERWHSNTLVVNSSVTSTHTGGRSGISLLGLQNTVKIGQGGSVDGTSIAISMAGDHIELVNDGAIKGATGSVQITGSSYASFVNSGNVTNGVTLASPEIVVHLAQGSTLQRDLYIESENGTALVINEGMIGANGGWSVYGGLGDDTFINAKGTVTGNIDLYHGNDTFDNRGGKAAVFVYGGLGDDTFILDTADVKVREEKDGGTDTVQSTISLSLAQLYPNEELENLTLIGSAAIDGTGNALHNVLTGNDAANVLQGLDGNDTIDGGAGADQLEGGTGDDTYMVDDAGDTVIDGANAGTDTVITSVGYALPFNAHVEVLKAAAGASDLALTGNALSNTIVGGDGNDTLDGGMGADRLEGGLGDDTYVVDNGGDVVSDAGGTDTVRTDSNFSLAALASIENLEASGMAAVSLTGNGLANTITGSDGNETLDGAAGADRLEGGLGDDIYYVDDQGDMVVEAANAGSDTVIATASHAMTTDTHVEVLKAATGASGLALTGSGFANTIIGSAGHDTLDGGAGADRLEGGLGDDTYRLDSLDVVVDAGGTDTVATSVSFSLAALDPIERLMASGPASVTLTGNGLANTIAGGAGNDILDGGAGADRLEGGLGNDTYVVDAWDMVVDAGGTDTVVSSSSFSLASLASIEKLAASGSAAISLSGNALANTITGNGAANKLYGKAGKDALTGGLGKDVFVFDTKPNKKTNLDRIADFNVRDDSIWLDNKYMPKLGKGTPTKPVKLNAKFFTIGDKAKDANDYLVYNSKTGILSYDADGAGSGRAVEIAALKKGLKMTYADFFVV